MGIFSEFIDKIAEYFEEQMKRAAEALAAFAEYRELEDMGIIPCYSSPIEYARRRENRNTLADMFRGQSARYRARLYRLRFSPCCHRAGGVMIRKKGRLVRRKR